MAKRSDDPASVMPDDVEDGHDQSGDIGDVPDDPITAEQQEQEKAKAKEAEYEEVRQWRAEYDAAREFDKKARQQFAQDRLFASGRAGQNWAVNTNLIGSFIEILTALLYARDPDVSVRPAQWVRPSDPTNILPPNTNDDFARTLELVISRLWKQGRLKMRMRQDVRSGLTVGQGWLKVVMVSDSMPLPMVQSTLNDAREQLAQLSSLQAQQLTEEAKLELPEQKSARELEIERQIEACESRLELAIRRGLAIDLVPAEDFQCSLDVASTEDHRDGNWNGNDSYIPHDELLKSFPNLTDEDLTTATKYYRKALPDADSGALSEAHDHANSQVFAESGEGSPFARVSEVWCRIDQHIYTLIEGVRCWGREPYQPQYATTRFYPYFRLAFYEVDGERHPQSLASRLWKLQEEYASVRSNLRITRKRSIPGILVNGTQLADEEVKKMTVSETNEMVALKLTDPTQPIANAFAPKPVPTIDMRLFDTQPILADMERIAGIQEALTSTVTVQKTATEADIQQQGTAARTNANRDNEEVMLEDLAQYTAELAIQGLPLRDVQRIAGPGAFWPEGMAVEDLLTMADITIEAGSTGKPRNKGDRDAWGVILPVLQQTIGLIRQTQLSGDLDMARALEEMVYETMRRFGESVDLERFIPKPPAPPIPVPGLPGEPGAPGSPAAVAIPGVPPGASPAAPGSVDPALLATADAPSPVGV